MNEFFLYFVQDYNGAESSSEIIQPPLDYPPDIPSDIGDQIAIEPSPDEEPLEPGTQRQYSLSDFELIRWVRAH